MPRPTGLCIRAQIPAPRRIARPSQNSPTPSRRWSGCRSRALRPKRRAPKPTAPATSIHPAPDAWSSHLARITIGSFEGAGAPFFPPPPPPPAPPRPPAPRDPPLGPERPAPPPPADRLFVLRAPPPEPDLP